jgi:alpha-tubulin suppressor-like RCC1 family protein
MKKFLLLLTALIFYCNYLSAQNSMTGDGFGGRGWYVAHNYSVGAYSAYTVCGDSNQLYGWGSNIDGELGNGTNISAVVPVTGVGMKNVKFYTTGYLSALIKMDSTAWVWGYTGSGFTSYPVHVLDNVKFADGGNAHVVFVKNDSTVWGAGGNYDGNLGNGTFSTTTPVSVPVKMFGVNTAVRAVAAGIYGSAATVILLSDSTLKITGGDGLFQQVNSLTPVPISGLNNIVDVKANAWAVFALNDIGEVYAFGRDYSDYSILGVGSPSLNVTLPTKLIFPPGAGPIVALSSNNDGRSALALDNNHNVYGWGENVLGQLGDGSGTNQNSPILVATNVIDIFAGEDFSYVLKADGTLWATGTSKPGVNGFLGSIWMNLPNIQRNVFTQIDPTSPPMNLCAPKVWGVVPIKLSIFTCVANGNTAYLNWQSAEEINAGKYMVEYSKDGSNFQSIAIINAKGSNSKYNYIHQQVSGTAFYRLKMMDKDGSFKYSEIRVVKFDSKAGFTIAPNPANDIVYVFTKSNIIIKSIQILSIDGQVVKILNSYNNGQEISISNLAKGTYILKVLYQNNEMEYRRFIKL